MLCLRLQPSQKFCHVHDIVPAPSPWAERVFRFHFPRYNGNSPVPKDDRLCRSSPHRLRLLFHRSERGEGPRQNFLPLLQWLLFPSLPVVHHKGDFFRTFPIFSVSTQWGSWRKSLQEGLRLSLHSSPRGFTESCQ